MSIKKKDNLEYEYVKSEYARQTYEIYANPDNLSDDEVALIVSGGFHYGYRKQGENLFVIYTD